MKIKKVLLTTVMTLGALALYTLFNHVAAQQRSQASSCPLITEEEAKRRYPTIKVAPEKVFVVGSIGRPGPIEYKSGMTLMQAIDMVGGVLPDADKQSVRILKGRVGEPEREPVVLDLNAISEKRMPDLTLEGGDVIEVGSRCPVPVPPTRDIYGDPVRIVNPSHASLLCAEASVRA